MIDPFGRPITYLRLSVTDRCDLRCTYCMGEDVSFQPRSEVLTLEELERLCRAFVRKGIRKIRITGGEPLTRRNVMGLIANLGGMVAEGSLDELTLTTNGTRLAKHAAGLAAAGIRRVNVSLDSLDEATFAGITRRGDVGTVIEGLMQAKAAGLAVKVNTVVQKGINDREIDRLVAWCGGHGFDLCLIELMPMGGVGAGSGAYLPLMIVRQRLARSWTLLPTDHATGGPARYVQVAETGRRIGFITPMSNCFCAGCNRMRLTCTGVLHTCLDDWRGFDLRTPLRSGEADHVLEAVIDTAVTNKPGGHDFLGKTGSGRFMNVVGG
ncbi:MAG: molybdenum cofactor biosynthesis protein [Stygiobacter sp.]|nr:MAG: molybdenum cofactor biosynthesis protein [Stygiobacter sp.]